MKNKKNVIIRQVKEKKTVLTGSHKIPALVKKGKKSAYPGPVLPMLATLVDKPFDAPGWSYEVKWDGYRAIAGINKGKVELRSRNNKSFNEKFYPVYDALKKSRLQAVLDGEIIVSDSTGLADFGDLQNWRSEADGQLQFYVFDILWLNGYSLMTLPLYERRKILRSVIQARHPIIRVSEDFSATGTEFFKLAQKMQLEGIIAKRSDSEYTPGIR